MAKRKRKITPQDVTNAIAAAKDAAWMAGGVVLVQDHGFDTQSLGEFVLEAEKLFLAMLTGQPLPDERQQIADRLKAERLEEIEKQEKGLQDD